MQTFLCCKFWNVPPCLLLAATKAAAKPKVCDSGSRMFTFKVARPQQLDSFLYLFSPLLLSFALPAPSLANRKNLPDCHSFQPVLRRARHWQISASGASQRSAASERASALRVCTPLHSAGSRSHSYGRAREGPAPVNLCTSASKQHRPNRFNIATCSFYLLCRSHVPSWLLPQWTDPFGWSPKGLTQPVASRLTFCYPLRFITGWVWNALSVLAHFECASRTVFA